MQTCFLYTPVPISMLNSAFVFVKYLFTSLLGQTFVVSLFNNSVYNEADEPLIPFNSDLSRFFSWQILEK